MEVCKVFAGLSKMRDNLNERSLYRKFSRIWRFYLAESRKFLIQNVRDLYRMFPALTRYRNDRLSLQYL